MWNGIFADFNDRFIARVISVTGRDKDGVRHSVKMAWRCLAILQKEIEQESAHKEIA